MAKIEVVYYHALTVAASGKHRHVSGIKRSYSAFHTKRDVRLSGKVLVAIRLNTMTRHKNKSKLLHLLRSRGSPKLTYELVGSRFWVFSILGTRPRRLLPWSQIA